MLLINATHWAIRADIVRQVLARLEQAWSGALAELARLESIGAQAEASKAARAEALSGPRLPLAIDGAIARVDLAGVFIKDFPSNYPEFWGVVDTRKALRAIQQAVADPAVGVIVLRIDSPGGSVDGLAELGDALFAARQAKPVIAQVDGLCASAAYYCASQATEIRAGRNDLIGSIGTISVIDDYSKRYEEAGIKTYVFATGEHKGAGVPGTVITENQQAEFQRVVDEYFADFKAVILRARPKLRAGLTALADGRVWLSADAQASGLIDKIATIDQTLAELKGQQASEAAARTRSARAKAAAMRYHDPA